ncbi:MAG: transcription elongation factor GreA [Aggregatilineales bacterium]
MSEPEKVYLTQDGAEELQKELDTLVEVRRPSLAQKLKEAVAQGDLKENADYHDAKEQQAFVEGRIQYLENVLRSAEIVSNDGNHDIVGIGSHVTLRFEDEDDDETYIIVGAAEANPREGKISHESPIGKVLMDCKKGDKVRAQTPSGMVSIKIMKIK